ncbi:alpha-protein kinase 3 isoform X2 [Dunckerocampus dactyliophorus]|uniref:alpha-protein kinase 3 isoform X2 n=1 Tax=Dunckerocampus dactyliophorus TaxID=161453 RepID=UPI002405FB0D|nr:alpha-protein kinase 3 isoform X2 [Dunckerocampus dactyliophorus]
MGSRRTMARSSSANGRSSDGNGSIGSSRPGGCSYISNVRPENRSTLCSVMAQLTEEEQPSFATTLRSKAVSENCNVKFYCVVTGYPIPQVTWYKDDKQLDRFCGLPKYEIFRNGQNHSLHIYNCTVDDAAIYQASASNSKGIVSCSGVLEVGGMSEFKIHQRYFAKLKQKAENRCKEAEGKENQEPLRTVSPERWQRKRRSTMEAFLSMPSSTEDEGNEEVGRSVAVESEVRLEEHTEELVEETTSSVTCSKTSQLIHENGSVGGKTPFVKKKIKISSSAKMEQAEEMPEEVMEVQSFIPPVLENGRFSRNTSSEELMKPSLDLSKESAKKEKASNSKHEEKVSEKKTQSLHVTSRLQSAPPRPVTEDMTTTKTKNVPVMANSSTDADLGSVHLVPPSQAILPGPSYQQTSDQPPEKEAKPCPGNSSVPIEVTQARTWMSRNDAPVNPEPPPDCRSVDVRPQQKAPATIDDGLPLFIAPIVELTQNTRHHSTGSNESHTGLYARPRKSAIVPSVEPQSQTGLVVKCVEGIKGNEKVEGNEISKSVVLGETSSSCKIQLDTGDKVKKVSNPMDVCVSKTKKTECSLKPNPELQTNKPTKTNTVTPHSKKYPNLHEQQPEDVQEIPKPLTRVISVAELLRSQIRTLESELTSPINVGLVEDQPQMLRNYDNKCKSEVKKSAPGSLLESLVGRTSPSEHLVKQSHQGKNKTQDAISTTLQKDPSSSVPAPFVQEGNQDFLNIPQVGSLTSLPMTPKEEETQRPASRASSNVIQGKDSGLIKKFIPETELNNEIQHSSQTLVDQEHCPTHCLQEVQMFSDKSVLGTVTQENLSVQKSQSLVEVIPGSDFLTNSNPKSSPVLMKRPCDSLVPSATAQELASGARRKVLNSKVKPVDNAETDLPPYQPQKQEISPPDSNVSTSAVTILSSPSCSRQPPLLQPNDERTSPAERRSPLPGRDKVTTASSQPPNEEVQSEKSEKTRRDPCKAPQVIRKIRSERFADASGHLKLWCQFFNILSDSTITWYRNQAEIARIMRTAADESQANLAVVQASSKDSGVYKCTITNEYGSDSTDFQLGPDILARFSLREDNGVGEEIEMAPLVFSKGVADGGVWGGNFFGRIVVQKSCISDSCTQKVWRAKVIYGLEPVFESGNTCIIKVLRHVAYGGKEEHCLIDRNMDLVKQECKIQNLAREYCKIFSAEARVVENFGPPLEVVPLYLMYRPANTIPYATVEADLTGAYQKYAFLDDTGGMERRTASEVELKCCALQHWIFQWTNGNLLITRLEGVDTKLTNVGMAVKSTGPQGGRKAGGSPRLSRKAEQDGRKTPTGQKAADAPEAHS